MTITHIVSYICLWPKDLKLVINHVFYKVHDAIDSFHFSSHTTTKSSYQRLVI